jgi:hypothetical protein
MQRVGGKGSAIEREECAAQWIRERRRATGEDSDAVGVMVRLGF